MSNNKIAIQIILILILMLITIINMYTTSFAKYVFEYTIDAAEIKIEKITESCIKTPIVEKIKI